MPVEFIDILPLNMGGPFNHCSYKPLNKRIYHKGWEGRKHWELIQGTDGNLSSTTPAETSVAYVLELFSFISRSLEQENFLADCAQCWCGVSGEDWWCLDFHALQLKPFGLVHTCWRTICLVRKTSLQVLLLELGVGVSHPAVSQWLFLCLTWAFHVLQ